MPSVAYRGHPFTRPKLEREQAWVRVSDRAPPTGDMATATPTAIGAENRQAEQPLVQRGRHPEQPRHLTSVAIRAFAERPAEAEILGDPGVGVLTASPVLKAESPAAVRRSQFLADKMKPVLVPGEPSTVDDPRVVEALQGKRLPNPESEEERMHPGTGIRPGFVSDAWQRNWT